MYTIHYTVYSIQYKHSVHYTLYSIQYKHRVDYTLYSIQYMYIVHLIMHRKRDPIRYPKLSPTSTYKSNVSPNFSRGLKLAYPTSGKPESKSESRFDETKDMRWEAMLTTRRLPT